MKTKYIYFFRKKNSAQIALYILFIFSFSLVTKSASFLPSNIKNIQSHELKRHLSFLASSELGGRYTLSQSNRIAARYLASQLEYYGYHGIQSDGSFFQPVPLITRENNLLSSKIKLSNSSSEFVYGEDFISSDLSIIPQKADISAEIVFLGYGISSPENNYDDYKEININKKIATFVMSGTPKELDGKYIPEISRGINAAIAHGCSGILILPDDSLTNAWPQIKNSIITRHKQDPVIDLSNSNTIDSISKVPIITASPILAQTILTSSKLSASNVRALASIGDSLNPKALGVIGHIVLTNNERSEVGQNVVGILEGQHPKLKNEYIVLSAHYDHLESIGKKIYLGADDNGSGVSAVLEIARLFAQEKSSDRSVIVLFTTGEELGLLGSSYFVQHPPVSLKHIIANFNVDMIGRVRCPSNHSPLDSKLADNDSLYLIGADKHSLEFNDISEQVNQDLTKFKLDYSYNNENDSSRLFYRSDHWSFAKEGIPIIFYFNGLHSDYHQPSDTIDKIDFEKMVRVAQLIYGTAWRIANLNHALKIDRWKNN